MYLSSDAAIPLSGIYPDQNENTRKRVFVASLFVIAKYWKLPTCSNTGHRLNVRVAGTHQGAVASPNCKRKQGRRQGGDREFSTTYSMKRANKRAYTILTVHFLMRSLQCGSMRHSFVLREYTVFKIRSKRCSQLYFE